ncbi:LOW QUALITY PROTEIN: dynein heavy chain [Plakobranchus ocellatus]|uniref:Dynein heavy chain n=1 Tax=Plakobranchus ocellatus TaxID=259542 RepID=A0AAV3Y0F2_9GAST|nr:LOW QUALITY PROTEIN: dynein heavy chain [Plakobranchus ocellatus]
MGSRSKEAIGKKMSSGSMSSSSSVVSSINVSFSKYYSKNDDDAQITWEQICKPWLNEEGALYLKQATSTPPLKDFYMIYVDPHQVSKYTLMRCGTTLPDNEYNISKIRKEKYTFQIIRPASVHDSFDLPLYTTATPVITFDLPLYTTATPVITFDLPLYMKTTPVITFDLPLYTTATPAITFDRPLYTKTIPVITFDLPLYMKTTPVINVLRNFDLDAETR